MISGRDGQEDDFDQSYTEKKIYLASFAPYVQLEEWVLSGFYWLRRNFFKEKKVVLIKVAFQVPS